MIGEHGREGKGKGEREGKSKGRDGNGKANGREGKERKVGNKLMGTFNEFSKQITFFFLCQHHSTTSFIGTKRAKAV